MQSHGRCSTNVEAIKYSCILSIQMWLNEADDMILFTGIYKYDSGYLPKNYLP